MGLLGFLKKTPQELGCLSGIAPWKVPKTKQSVLLAEEVDAKVYVYDAAPLAAVDPDRFLLDVAYLDGTLHSQYTGNEVDTAAHGFVVAMYGGMPVGTVSIRRDMVEHCAANGRALQVAAYSDGWIQFGSQQIRNVKARVPKGWEF